MMTGAMLGINLRVSMFGCCLFSWGLYISASCAKCFSDKKGLRIMGLDSHTLFIFISFPSDVSCAVGQGMSEDIQ